MQNKQNWLMNRKYSFALDNPLLLYPFYNVMLDCARNVQAKFMLSGFFDFGRRFNFLFLGTSEV